MFWYGLGNFTSTDITFMRTESDGNCIDLARYTWGLLYWPQALLKNNLIDLECHTWQQLYWPWVPYMRTIVLTSSATHEDNVLTLSAILGDNYIDLKRYTWGQLYWPWAPHLRTIILGRLLFTKKSNYQLVPPVFMVHFSYCLWNSFYFLSHLSLKYVGNCIIPFRNWLHLLKL
jgi:hypothetical protein